MKVAISGASGFIGTYLSWHFAENGHTVFPLNRKILALESNTELAGILSHSDVVINLAGAPINHRWTKSYKRELYDSRIKTTRKIVDTINQIDNKPKLLISTSAVGYYPYQGCYDEYHAAKGDGFLSHLCEQWEEEARAVSSDVRLVITRFGVVLAPHGGAFEQMMRPAKMGVAVIIGPGDQPFPWIDIADLTQAMEHVIHHTDISGVVNFTSAHQITNKELMLAAAKHYRSVLTINIPAVAFRMLFGESAEFMTKGQCVKPVKLLGSGFKFKSPTILDFYSKIC